MRRAHRKALTVVLTTALLAACSAARPTVEATRSTASAPTVSARSNPTVPAVVRPSPIPARKALPPKQAAVSALILQPAPCSGTAIPPRWDHVIWIWMENHSYSQVIGSSAAPYENALARGCGLATNYHGVTHPSLPNYIAATGGTTAGITTDCSPSRSCESTGQSIFGQAASSGRQWRSYQESMPSNCDLSSAGEYAVKHNPAAYFPAIRSQCRSWDVPFGTTSSGRFVSDLNAGRLQSFSFITPNLCHDTHDCSVATGDAWLKAVVGRIVASATYRAGRTALVITWDEGFGSTNQVATIVVAPSVRRGARSSTRFDHYSLLRTTEEMLRLAKIGHAASAASMRPAFHL